MVMMEAEALVGKDQPVHGNTHNDVTPRVENMFAC